MDLKSGLIATHSTGAIGWLIFDNPTKLNALSAGMSEDALTVIEAYDADPAIKVVIMRGSGEKAFISGGDISSFEKTRGNAEAEARARKIPNILNERMSTMSKPLIAMIHGYCLGGGLGMALNADMRFASTKAQIGIPAAQRSIAYPLAGLKKLVDVVGPSTAKDIMFSARRIGAEEALRLGLINRVFEESELEAKTLEYANIVANNAPLSIRSSKFVINQLGLEKAQRDEEKIIALQNDASNSDDFKEATRAFMEKRKPVFQGR